MKKNWWKILCVLLLMYTIIAGFLSDVPRLPILHETIRNQYFHVCMWFSMMILFTVSLVFSIRHLSGNNIGLDLVASEAVNTGMLFGILGLLTGSLWARYTWGAWWTNDVKLNGAAITMLTYSAYLVLRNAIPDEQKRGKVAAVYNIFAFVMMLVFIQIYPRMNDSLHPGNGGNPAFSKYDLDSGMRMVFYPAVIGWTLLGVWMMSIRIRIQKIKSQTEL
jgi:heme exporter protein C